MQNQLPRNTRKFDMSKIMNNSLLVTVIILIVVNLSLYYLAHINIYDVSYLLPFICGQFIGLALLDKEKSK